MLGVDPGLTRCGLGVVEGAPGPAGGVRRRGGGAHAGRRRPRPRGWSRSSSEVEAWLDLHRPDAVAVERVFAQANVRTVMGTAQAGAVAIVAAARRGLPVALHTPSEVKAAVTGSGRADKAQVGAMVARLLRLAARRSPPTPPTRWRSPSATCGARPRRPGSPRPARLPRGPAGPSRTRERP